MKIEIYADIHCPYCYLGKRRLERDLAMVPWGEKVQILYRGYVLDPKAPNFSGKSVYQAQADRKGVPVAKIQEAYANIAETGKAFDLDYQMDAIIPTNTIQALALVQYAQELGLQNVVMEKLFAAYYTHGENVSDPSVLRRIGSESGLDLSQLEAALASEAYQKQVLKDDETARAQKIDGIPYFVVDGEQAFFGSDQTAKVVGYLQSKRPKIREITPPTGMMCEGGSCRMG